MRVKTLSLLTGFGAALVVSAGANAAYTGLSTTAVNSTVTFDSDVPSLTNVAVTIHRVWANFTNAADALFVWGGGGGLGTGVVDNTNSTGTGLGTGFYNDVNGGLLPPNASAGVGARDSYWTIGVSVLNQIPAGQGISLLVIPGSPGDVTGNHIDVSAAGGGITTTPTTSSGAPNPISLAGFTGDGDPALRVLMMQLAVGQGQNVRGTVGITINLGALAGATTTIQNNAFNSIVPAPGALALLGVAGLLGARRRRG